MAFGTLNSILSTTVSITYTCCCAIVLMLHNGWAMCSCPCTNLKYCTKLIGQLHIARVSTSCL